MPPARLGRLVVVSSSGLLVSLGNDKTRGKDGWKGSRGGGPCVALGRLEGSGTVQRSSDIPWVNQEGAGSARTKER